MAQAVAGQTKRSAWKVLGLALSNRKTVFMLLFGFAQGLPPALFLGTLYAWLSEADVDLETMGVFSLVGLAYAFQFLWSPLLDRVDIPGVRKLGKRKQWIAPMQLIVGIALVVMSTLNPATSLGWFSLLAAIGAFASATQDIGINAWRIDVADEVATLDILPICVMVDRISRSRRSISCPPSRRWASVSPASSAVRSASFWRKRTAGRGSMSCSASSCWRSG